MTTLTNEQLRSDARIKELCSFMRNRFSMNPVSCKILGEEWNKTFPDECAVADVMLGLLTRVGAAEARLHDVAVHCANVEAQLAELQKQDGWVNFRQTIPAEGKYYVRDETQVGPQYAIAQYYEHNFCAGGDNRHWIWLADYSRTINALENVTHYHALPVKLEDFSAPVMICDVCGHDAFLSENDWYECEFGHSFQVRQSAASQPPAVPVVPDDLLTAVEEVIRISDRKHEAWNRAKAAISSYRTAMLQLAK